MHCGSLKYCFWLSGLLRRDESFAISNDKAYYPTSLTGLAIGQYINEDYKTYDSNKVLVSESGNAAKYGKYDSVVTLDDIQIIGEAPQVLGASVKTTEDANKQDIRFGVSFAENSDLKAQGYSVKAYGAVVAFAKALPAGEPLTMDSVYTADYASYKPVVKRIEADTLPATTYVNIGDSAAGVENLGIRYQVRAFAVYEKNGEELVVYSNNDTKGKTVNGECNRSIFTTGKSIAKAIQAASGFTAQETYTVGEESITCEQIAAIISGTAASQTIIEGTGVKSGEALLAFTAAHASLIK